MRVARIGTHTVRVVSGLEASKWVQEPTKGLKTYDAPQMRTGLSLKTKGVLRGVEVKHSLMYFTNNANCPQQNRLVYFTPHCSPNGNGGNSVCEGEDWRRAIALFAARTLIGQTWFNDKDEYRLPYTYREVVK